ncbi:hypothetical protein F6S12_20005 [Pseudomonas sp. JV245A]|nr:hypothetical protein [Pseudomonas sp. JV245A]
MSRSTGLGGQVGHRYVFKNKPDLPRLPLTSAARKNRLFDDQALDIALNRLTTSKFSLELVTY